ncbi:MAG: hypothetical protein Q4G04_06580 [bacterium]|nr:hypothetical protein [bacterium]
MKKKILTGLFAVVMCFALVGCGKEETPNDNTGTNNGGTGQQEKPNDNPSLGVGKYKVEKGNNSVAVITNDGSGISTTTYYFTGDKITSATLVEEFSSKSIAETSYNTMKNEPAIMNSYSDIKLDGKKVVLTVKEEILSAYSTFGYDAFYDLMTQTYQAYID